MIQADLLSAVYSERLGEVLDVSWRILKSRFIDGRHAIPKEAPFQHYFAQIISSIGESYCSERSDQFLVDLETRIDNVKGKSKYLDITCEFPVQKVSAAIELKFKTAKQAAQDHGRIDAHVDIEALEIACQHHDFNFGRFYMITDSTAYVKQSTKGVGTVFTTHDGATTKAGKKFHCPKSKGREDVVVQLTDSYEFKWEQAKDRDNKDWYFLELKINPKIPSLRSPRPQR